MRSYRNSTCGYRDYEVADVPQIVARLPEPIGVVGHERKIPKLVSPS